MNFLAEDHEIDSLLNDEGDATFFESIRSKRLLELSVPTSNKSSLMDTSEVFGYLSEIGHEKEVMHLSTTLPRLVVHFYNPAFKNCQLLNEHLNVNNEMIFI